METIINALRNILGTPDFYKNLSGSNYTWDYGAMLEYFLAGMLVLIVVGSIFRILIRSGSSWWFWFCPVACVRYIQ